MIGEMTYEEMLEAANSLASSSGSIREIIGKSNSEKLDGVLEFCDTIDSYSRFLYSSIELYKDSDDALKIMIEKNK